MERNIDYKKLDDIVLLKEKLDKIQYSRNLFSKILMVEDLNNIENLQEDIDVVVIVRSKRKDLLVLESSESFFNEIDLMKEIMKNFDLKISIIETQIEQLLS